MPNIHPIDEESARRIVAGQAITDLPSAVKELVDNALDANSKRINIRLFNQGLDILEVTDDGCGVPKDSRQLLATPHATSKIQSFEDIYDRNREGLTMGFRGEALFCLANLSANLVVATRTADEPLAQKLEFGHDGQVKPESVAAMPRKVGTTVAVVRLLDSLPVRRADMTRRIQAQRSKLLTLMEGYAIFSVGVQVRLIDMVPAPHNSLRENVLLGTPDNSKVIDETISSVLGSKMFASMCPIEVDLRAALEDYPPTQDSGASEEKKTTEPALGEAGVLKWKVKGYMSKINQSPPSSRTGQYFCINRRPVELPRVARLLNDTWRSLLIGKSSSRPSCVLHFTLPNDKFDINLSPDKRQVMFPNEKHIYRLIQEAITALWSTQLDGQFQLNGSLADTDPPDSERIDGPYEAEIADDIDADLDNDLPSRFNRRYAFCHDIKKAKLQHEYDDGRKTKDRNEKISNTGIPPEELPLGKPPAKRVTIECASNPPSPLHDGSPPMPATKLSQIETIPLQNESETILFQSESTKSPLPLDCTAKDDSESICNSKSVTPSPAAVTRIPSSDHSLDRLETAVNDAEEESCGRKSEDATISERRQWRAVQEKFMSPSSSGLSEEIGALEQSTKSLIKEDKAMSKDRTSNYNLERFGFKAVSQRRSDSLVEDTANSAKQTFSSIPRVDRAPMQQDRIVSGETNRENSLNNTDEDKRQAHSPECASPVVWDSFPNTEEIIQASRRQQVAIRQRKRSFNEMSSKTASPELSAWSEEATAKSTVSLNKEDLKSLTVIGQFNMGFILAKSPDNHLWILDQHACDEKYNFEKLCRETVIREQTLIAPIALELSPAEEMCVLDNINIFEKNGFRFKYDPDKPPRHRLALTALPHSGACDGRKAVQFGKEDVSALCSILGVDGDLDDDVRILGGGTGTDGSGMYGNNAVRRYAGAVGESADRIIARLPKAIAMFASRACRSSVMIGKALSKTEMERIVALLAELEHPWNCAHGRPTMQHVGDLQPLLLSDEGKSTAT